MDPSTSDRCVVCGEDRTHFELCDRCFGRMTICPFCKQALSTYSDHADCWIFIEEADRRLEERRQEYAAFSNISDLQIHSDTGLIRDIVLLDREGKKIDIASKERALRQKIDPDASKKVRVIYPFITIANGRWSAFLERSHAIVEHGFLTSLPSFSTPEPPRFFECAAMQEFDTKFFIDANCRDLSEIRARWPTATWQVVRYFSTPHGKPVRRSTREMSVDRVFERSDDFYWTNIRSARTNEEMQANLFAASQLDHRTRFSPLIGCLDVSFLPRLNGRFAIAIVPEIVRPQVDLDNDCFDNIEREAIFSTSLYYFAAASDSLDEIAQMRHIGRIDRFRTRLEVEIDQRTKIFFHHMLYPDASYENIADIIAHSDSSPDGRKLIRCFVSVTFDGVLVADAVDFG